MVINDCCHADNPQLIFQHIKSHTNSPDTPSILNQSVDELAANAHADPYTQFAPLLTFVFDCYILWKGGTGFIENNVTSFIEDELAHIHAMSLHYTSGDQFPLPSHSNPQIFLYTCSSSSYSALVQLCLRSGQLPTW